MSDNAREEEATMVSASTRESGVGLVELFLGSIVLACAVLGIVGGLMTSLNLAIEDRTARQIVGPGHRRVRTRIILDATCFGPPIDLNDDGDCDDADLRPKQVNAAFLEMRLTWGRDKSFTAVELVRRASRGADARVRPSARPRQVAPRSRLDKSPR